MRNAFNHLLNDSLNDSIDYLDVCAKGNTSMQKSSQQDFSQLTYTQEPAMMTSNYFNNSINNENLTALTHSRRSSLTFPYVEMNGVPSNNNGEAISFGYEDAHILQLLATLGQQQPCDNLADLANNIANPCQLDQELSYHSGHDCNSFINRSGYEATQASCHPNTVTLGASNMMMTSPSRRSSLGVGASNMFMTSSSRRSSLGVDASNILMTSSSRRSSLGVSLEDIENFLNVDSIGNNAVQNRRSSDITLSKLRSFNDISSSLHMLEKSQKRVDTGNASFNDFFNQVNNNTQKLGKEALSYSSLDSSLIEVDHFNPLDTRSPSFSVSFAEKYQSYLKSLVTLMARSSQSRRGVEDVKRYLTKERQERKNHRFVYAEIKSVRRKSSKKKAKTPTKSKRTALKKKQLIFSHERTLSIGFCTPEMIFG